AIERTEARRRVEVRAIEINSAGRSERVGRDGMKRIDGDLVRVTEPRDAATAHRYARRVNVRGRQLLGGDRAGSRQVAENVETAVDCQRPIDLKRDRPIIAAWADRAIG